MRLLNVLFLIKNTFHVKEYQTDSDSVRFKVDNFENWKLLNGPSTELNAKEHVQLRLEAIDRSETHYSRHHQPLEFGNPTTDFSNLSTWNYLCKMGFQA